MLRELGLVEQRYQAVREVLNDGATVTDVARRNGVSRQTVHEWLVRYANRGLPGLMDRSCKPQSCLHQMSPVVEARVVELRREHPGWGPRTLQHRLGAEGFAAVPGRTSIYRCLVRHGLISPQARRRSRADYRRWERSRAMELWQLDVLGGVRLVDGFEAKIITGIDDHSRFCVSAFVVARAAARPTCDALALALRNHGAPAQILTDNGKVFTNRFGNGSGEVLFDRMCREHGIKHVLTAPRSPTTTGKVERFHKTLRAEFLAGKTFESLEDAQMKLDAWGRTYNHERPHQSLSMAVPWDRFRLVKTAPVEPVEPVVEAEPNTAVATVTRRLGRNGLISFAAANYRAEMWLAGENVSVICEDGLVHLHHRGVLVATYARRHAIDKQTAGLRRGVRPARSKRPGATTASVTRKVDGSGNVCFAGTSYRADLWLSLEEHRLRGGVLRRLRQEVVGLLDAIEKEGITQFGGHIRESSPAVDQLLEKFPVDGATSSPIQEQPRVQILPPGLVGMAGPEALLEALTEVAFREDNRRKLRAGGMHECHLFVWVHPWLPVAAAMEEQPPSLPISLPPEVSHLWAALNSTKARPLWRFSVADGWRTYDSST